MIPPLGNYIKRPLDAEIDQKITDLDDRTSSLETSVESVEENIQSLVDDGEWIGL